MRILKKGNNNNNNTKRLAYTALVRPMLECGAECCDPYRESQVSPVCETTDELGWLVEGM